MYSHAPARLRAKTNLSRTQLALSRGLITCANVSYELHTSYCKPSCLVFSTFCQKHVMFGTEITPLDPHENELNDTVFGMKKGEAVQNKSKKRKCPKTNGAHCISVKFALPSKKHLDLCLFSRTGLPYFVKHINSKPPINRFISLSDMRKNDLHCQVHLPSQM